LILFTATTPAASQFSEMLPMIGGLLEKILIPFFIFGQKKGLPRQPLLEIQMQFLR
jgi:hypothetical protein